MASTTQKSREKDASRVGRWRDVLLELDSQKSSKFQSPASMSASVSEFTRLLDTMDDIFTFDEFAANMLLGPSSMSMSIDSQHDDDDYDNDKQEESTKPPIQSESPALREPTRSPAPSSFATSSPTNTNSDEKLPRKPHDDLSSNGPSTRETPSQSPLSTATSMTPTMRVDTPKPTIEGKSSAIPSSKPSEEILSNNVERPSPSPSQMPPKTPTTPSPVTETAEATIAPTHKISSLDGTEATSRVPTLDAVPTTRPSINLTPTLVSPGPINKPESSGTPFLLPIMSVAPISNDQKSEAPTTLTMSAAPSHTNQKSDAPVTHAPPTNSQMPTSPPHSVSSAPSQQPKTTVMPFPTASPLASSTNTPSAPVLATDATSGQPTTFPSAESLSLPTTAHPVTLGTAIPTPTIPAEYPPTTTRYCPFTDNATITKPPAVESFLIRFFYTLEANASVGDELVSAMGQVIADEVFASLVDCGNGRLLRNRQLSDVQVVGVDSMPEDECLDPCVPQNPAATDCCLIDAAVTISVRNATSDFETVQNCTLQTVQSTLQSNETTLPSSVVQWKYSGVHSEGPAPAPSKATNILDVTSTQQNDRIPDAYAVLISITLFGCLVLFLFAGEVRSCLWRVYRKSLLSPNSYRNLERGSNSSGSRGGIEENEEIVDVDKDHVVPNTPTSQRTSRTAAQMSPSSLSSDGSPCESYDQVELPDRKKFTTSSGEVIELTSQENNLYGIDPYLRATMLLDTLLDDIIEVSDEDKDSSLSGKSSEDTAPKPLLPGVRTLDETTDWLTPMDGVEI